MKLTAQMVVSPKLAPKLEKISTDVAKFRALKEIAGRIEQAAKAAVPVAEGDLRDSIRIRYHQKYSGKMVAIIGSTLPYARRIERGFVKADSLGRVYDQPAQPFLRPARRKHNAKHLKELIKQEIAGPLKTL